MASRLIRALALFAVVGVLAFGVTSQNTESTRAGALGGPVILGGDDMQDHGGIDGAGNVVLGWLYIKNSIATLDANASRGDGTVAALGSEADLETGSGAGAALTAALNELGLTATFYNGETAINGFFSSLSGGTTNPSIIWIAGTGAGNDLGDGPGDEPAALTANAAAIASFVAGGGGLMSHGTVYGWLQALLPGATTVDGGSSQDLFFTPEGAAAFPTLTVSDINAGPWHNHFEGNFGGLQVLVRSSSVDDATGTDAAVVLGGAQVTFEERPPSVIATPPTDCLPGVPGLPCGGQAGGGSPEQFQPNQADAAPPPAPAPEEPAPAPAPGEPAPAPVSEAAGIAITAPDTGTGPTGGSDWTWMLLAAAAVGATGAAAAIAGSRLRG